MEISVKDVEHVARLARLALDENEKQNFANQLSKIILHIEKLNQLNTDSVPPTAHPFFEGTVWRKDECTQENWTESILKNAPEKEENFFKVKKIIE